MRAESLDSPPRAAVRRLVAREAAVGTAPTSSSVAKASREHEPRDEPAAARRRLRRRRAAPAAQLPQVRAARRGPGRLVWNWLALAQAPRPADAAARLDVLALRRAALRDRGPASDFDEDGADLDASTSSRRTSCCRGRCATVLEQEGIERVHRRDARPASRRRSRLRPARRATSSSSSSRRRSTSASSTSSPSSR